MLLGTKSLQKPWDALPINLQINTSVPQVLYKDQQSNIVKKALTMAVIPESFPEESWRHVYTDGSATNAVTDETAGIYAKFPDQPTEAVCLATGKFCSIKSARYAEWLSSGYPLIVVSWAMNSLISLLNGGCREPGHPPRAKEPDQSHQQAGAWDMIWYGVPIPEKRKKKDWQKQLQIKNTI